MVQSKSRAERKAMEALNTAAMSIPPRDLSSNSFWNKLGRPKFIAAPMVRHTDLPCRMQLRKHGAQLAYTSMIDSDKFIAAEDSERKRFFTTDKMDRPLVAQFGATNANDFVQACTILQKDVDAVCLNMDCPQRRAAQQGFGAYLMKDNTDEVYNIVRRASMELTVPVVCKIRLFSLPATVGNGFKSVPLVSKTIEFCKELEKAGCSLVAIHGRTIDMSNSGASCRDSKNHRPVYPSDYDAIHAIQKHLTIPVVANGDIRSMADVKACLKKTGADAAMVATELLYNPHMFSMPSDAVRQVVTPTRQLLFAAEYLYTCSRYSGATPETLKSHLVDSIIVPTLSPERKREMIPFGDGVETREDAERRLLEIAVLLSVLCGGKDECVRLGELEGGLERAMGVLDDSGKCVKWMQEEGGGTLEERTDKVIQLFKIGRELMRDWKEGMKGPSVPLLAGEETKKRKAAESTMKEKGTEKKRKKFVFKMARKLLKKSGGGKMKIKELAKAVSGKLGELEKTKEVRKLLKDAIKMDKKTRIRMEGKIALLDNAQRLI